MTKSFDFAFIKSEKSLLFITWKNGSRYKENKCVCNLVKDLSKNDSIHISKANEVLCILTAVCVLLEACTCVVYMKPAYLTRF